MHHADIKASIEKAGFTQKALAERIGISEAFLSLVIRGDRRSLRVARALSEALGLPIGRLWPGVYGDRAA